MMRKASERMVTLESIEHFNAQGMRRLHGVVLYVGARRRKFQCDIWGDKEGCLLVRFHCPTESDYDESYGVIGLSMLDLSQDDLEDAEIGDYMWATWVPQCIRDRWGLWLTSVI
jgi:hypothetical protein